MAKKKDDKNKVVDKLETASAAPAPTKDEKKKNEEPGYLCSSLNHPAEVSYYGMSMMIPPRAHRLKVNDHKKIGALPKGIRLLKK